MATFRSLKWTETSDPKAPYFAVSVDFGVDSEWIVSTGASRFDRMTYARYATIDNTGSSIAVSFSAGPVSFNVPAYSRQTFPLNEFTDHITLKGSTYACGVSLFVTRDMSGGVIQDIFGSATSANGGAKDPDFAKVSWLIEPGKSDTIIADYSPQKREVLTAGTVGTTSVNPWGLSSAIIGSGGKIYTNSAFVADCRAQPFVAEAVFYPVSGASGAVLSAVYFYASNADRGPFEISLNANGTVHWRTGGASSVPNIDAGNYTVNAANHACMSITGGTISSGLLTDAVANCYLNGVRVAVLSNVTVDIPGTGISIGQQVSSSVGFLNQLTSGCLVSAARLTIGSDRGYIGGVIPNAADADKAFLKQ